MKRLRLSLVISLAFCLTAVLQLDAIATIRYSVKPMPESKQGLVEMSVPSKSGELQVQIPQWMPGFYMLQNGARNLKDIAASGRDGRPCAIESTDDHTWKVKGTGSFKLTYKAPLEFQNGVGHYSGTSVGFG